MAFAAARSSQDTMAEMNITPLVDVMLVLLVIFMVTAPLMENRIPLGLSQPSPIRTEPPPVVALHVEAGDLFRLDGQAVGGPALEQALAERFAREPGLVLKVQVAPEADYQSAATALAAAKRAGVANVALD
jgi:biopolymer transport protein ExbD